MDELRRYLFLKGTHGAPWEYVELVLCRDIYHCTPSELDQQDLERIMLHIDMMKLEEEIRQFNKAK